MTTAKIHAKQNGLLSGVKVLEETPEYFLVHAVDEKRPKKIMKTDPKNKLFDNPDQAIEWIESFRKK